MQAKCPKQKWHENKIYNKWSITKLTNDSIYITNKHYAWKYNQYNYCITKNKYCIFINILDWCGIVKEISKHLYICIVLFFSSEYIWWNYYIFRIIYIFYSFFLENGKKKIRHLKPSVWDFNPEKSLLVHDLANIPNCSSFVR